MDSTRWDETWHRLREWTNGQGPSERLAAQVLIHEGFQSLDPSHPLGGRDGGKDATCIRNGQKWIMAVYFPRGQKDYSEIEKKLAGDISGAKNHNPFGLAFVTNQELTLSQRKSLNNRVSPLKLELYHLERVTTILDIPEMAEVRKQFLGIDSKVKVPTLELHFANSFTKEALGNEIRLQSIAHALHDQPIPDLKQPRESIGSFSMPVSALDMVNSSYMRDKEKYIRTSKLCQEVYLSLYNSSSNMAENVRIEVEGTLSRGIYIAEELP